MSMMLNKHMENITAWREFLGKAIIDTQERQRIANELGVSPVTLTRWSNGISNPRPQNIRHLLQALPQHRATLAELMCEEFPDIIQYIEESPEKDESQEIPVELYTYVMHALAIVGKSQRFWALSNSIIHQALGQLDTNHVGLAITLVKCMPPNNGIVRSLREYVVHGTSPWRSNMEQNAVLLGSESMAGFTAMNGRPLLRQSQEIYESRFPAHWPEWEVSAIAYPIQRSGTIAGSIVVSSTQPDYFLPFRARLIEQYSELLALAFESEEFYPLDVINLHEMPLYNEQHKVLSTLHRRATRLMQEATPKN